jgi:hypothetical protein
MVMMEKFTEAHFFAEINRLRALMGDRTFWNRPPEHRQTCLDGIGFVYLNLVKDDGSDPTSEQIDNWARIYQSTVDEYHNRETIILSMER